MPGHFSLVNKTRGKLPRVSFRTLKNKVLGDAYDLSVALIPPAQMREITLRTKHKDKVSNVLSFPLSKTSGEILLCPSAAKPYTLEYLFIHGLFHLKGLKHGGTMDHAEEQLLKHFKIHAKNSYRHRHRDLSR